MEIATEVLTPMQWELEINRFVEILEAARKQELLVSYGWGCDLDMDDLYQEVVLPLSGLTRWIQQSIKEGIFIFGEGTLHIQSYDKDIALELCHEGDIHLTADKNLVQQVVSEWTSRGIKSYEVPPRHEVTHS